MIQLAIDNRERFTEMVGDRLGELVLTRELSIILAQELIRKAKPIDHLRRNEKHIKKYWAQLRKRFTEMRDEVLAKIKNPPKSIYNWKKEQWVEKQEFDVEQWLFSKKKWRGTFGSDNGNMMGAVLEESGQQALDDLAIGVDFDNEDKVVLEWLNKNSKNMAWSITDTTYEAIKKTLMDGIAEGESIRKLRNRVMDAFDGISKGRGERIARTEVLKSSNRGSLIAWQQSGVVEGKQWAATMDKRTCPECAEMDGKTMALEKPFFEQGKEHTFESGNTMPFDYEEIMTPPLHPDCRCTLLAILKEV